MPPEIHFLLIAVLCLALIWDMDDYILLIPLLEVHLDVE
jgi:hypothetical protein